MSQVIALTADEETELTKSPFIVDTPVRFESHAGASVYATNLPGRDARGGEYQRFEGDGSKTVWTSTEVVNLANAHVDGGTLDDDDRLRVVLKVDGVVKKRVAASATPGAGEFKTSGSSPISLTLGDTVDDGGKIELFLRDADDITTLTIPANGVSHEEAAYQMVLADAATTVSRLVR